MRQGNILMGTNDMPTLKTVLISICVFVVMSSAFSNAYAAGNNWDSLLAVGVRCSGLPRELILSVIWNESRGNPNAVNINGVASYSPSSPEQALRYVYHHNRANVDVGLMQVNWLTWGPVYKLTVADLLDPATNVCVGSRIMRDYIAEHGGSWRGVGRYNAVSYNKQEAYAYRISQTIQQIQKLYRLAEN